MLTTPVVLVGCSKSKALGSAPARHLYTSDLFRKSVAYAECRGLPWAILSALHGLVLPDEVLEPYDFSAMKLKAGGSASLRVWGDKVAAQLEAAFPRAHFVLLAGTLYRAAVAPLGTSRYTEPMAGLEIGERLQWLKREIREPKAVAL